MSDRNEYQSYEFPVRETLLEDLENLLEEYLTLGLISEREMEAIRKTTRFVITGKCDEAN